ncbi:MAG TPA: hypothetical protein PKD85_07240 [Saprospiraceae bacterium]|nr:hypothetical protein [Saprospiraceae bacterium]
MNENSLRTIAWNELEPKIPNYFLVKKNEEIRGKYENCFSINEVFIVALTETDRLMKEID